MNNEFIPYEQASALKELGFNKRCIAYYTADKHQLALVQGYDNLMFADYVHLGNTIKSIPCPLYQQAFRFFREKYILDSIVQPTYSIKYQYRVFNLKTKYKVQVYGDHMGKEFSSFEEAEFECIKKLIELVKNKLIS